MQANKYQQNLKKAMNLLAKEGYMFIGQTVEYPGSPMFGSLEDVSKKQKIEFPVAENTQMGVSIGMNLEGVKVCSIFPRIDFMICAVDQLVNHLDKIKEMSQGEFSPGIIIRTQIGNTKPIYPGAQHCGDYTEGLDKMLKHVLVLNIKKEKQVISFYKNAVRRAKLGMSTLVIEAPSGAYGGKK